MMENGPGRALPWVSFSTQVLSLSWLQGTPRPRQESEPSPFVHGARGPSVPGKQGFAASGLKMWSSAHFPNPPFCLLSPGLWIQQRLPPMHGLPGNWMWNLFYKAEFLPHEVMEFIMQSWWRPWLGEKQHWGCHSHITDATYFTNQALTVALATTTRSLPWMNGRDFEEEKESLQVVNFLIFGFFHMKRKWIFRI